MFVGIQKNYIKYVLLIALMVINIQAYGQSRGRKTFAQGLSVSFLAGPNISAMDLGDNGLIGANYGFAFDKMLSSAWGLNVTVLAGNLGGERETDKYYFETDYKEIGVGLSADLTSLVNGYYRYRPVSIKLLGGIGVIAHDGMAYKADGTVDLVHIDNPEPGTDLFIKTGGIINYRLDPKWSFKVQGTVNYILGDRVDGYERQWRNGVPENTASNDTYASFLFGLEYTFDFAPFRSSPKFNRKNYARRYKQRFPKRSSYKKRKRY